MQINKEIRCSDEKVNDYIVSLEDYLVKIGVSNVYKLAVAIDNILGKHADHLNKLCEGKPTIFNENELEQAYAALDKVEKIRKLDELFKSLVPVIVSKDDDKEVTVDDNGKIVSLVPENENAFEILRDRVKNKVNGGK